MNVVSMTLTKDGMISELMEACKELDEVIRVSSARKLKFEQIIKALKKADNVEAKASPEQGDCESKEDNSEAAETTESGDSYFPC